MRDFNRNNRSDDQGGSRFGGRDSGRRSFGDRGPRVMHQATCAKCGKPCEVPFRPSGDRPVYCSNCYEQQGRSEGNDRRGDNRYFSKPRFEDRRPPAFSTNDTGNSNQQILEQLRNLNAKLDKIISAVVPKAVEPPKVNTADETAEMTKLITDKLQKVETKFAAMQDLEPKTKKTKVVKKKTAEVKV